ncbi:MAG: LamG domain-containing protein, partial [Anaerolineae bacterium]|nr:LamG domain-containing protein [Anaerolineae bacterium]
MGVDDGLFCEVGGSSFNTKGAMPIPANEWTHLALSYDGDTLRGYINGAAATSPTEGKSTQPIGQGGNLVIGGAPWSPKDFAVQGEIRDVRIWDRVLSSEEIVQGMDAPPDDVTHLVGYWKLDDGQGTAVRDSSPRQRHGAFNTAPQWKSDPLIAYYSTQVAAQDEDEAHGKWAAPQTRVAGQFGKEVLLFDTAVPQLDDITMEAWIRKDGAADGAGKDQRIINVQDESDACMLGVTKDGQLCAAVGERGVMTPANTQLLQPGWNHVAAVMSNNHALHFNGAQIGECAESEGLNPEEAFTIDGIVSWDGQEEGILISKTNGTINSYTLAVSKSGLLNLSAQFSPRSGNGPTSERLSIDFFPQKSDKSAANLTANKPYYIYAGCRIDTSDVSIDKQTNKVTEKSTISGFINVYSLEERKWLAATIPAAIISQDSVKQTVSPITVDGIVAFSASGKKPAVIGGQVSDNPDGTSQISRGYKGSIGTLRFWDRPLTFSDTNRLAQHPVVPEDMEPPAANWRFSEGSGLTSKDEEGEHNVSLSDSAMWQRSRLSTNFALYLNGNSIPNLEPCTADSLGGYSSLGQVALGGRQNMPTNADDIPAFLEYQFQGALDELRLWKVARTRQQIQENMHIEVEADAAGLIGYWPLTAGEGNSVKDWKNGSEATLSDPSKFWIEDYAAPVGNEAPSLLTDTFPVQSSWSVSAIEYGDLVTDDNGALRGVMKRCYALAKMDGSCELLANLKVGNLEMEYLGQAETDPTLIGYIEGAPPLPQENLTVPYYGNPRGYNSYAGAASVQFIEADNTLRTYSAHRDKGINYSVAAKFGFKGGADFYAGLGLEAEFLGTDNKIGAATSLDTSLGFLSGAEVTVGSTKTVTNEFQSGGGWTDGNKDNTPERCYVPDNIGYALIKSHVANVYALYAKKTRSLVAIHLSPDPDIPEDFSIISFKINPNYTKQGNLETYYRPKEAYDLIAQIEAYEAQLEADYQNYDTRKKAPQRETADDPLESITSEIEVPYDWEEMR